jgi:hypothetical protein
MRINDPKIVAELQAVYPQYEAALRSRVDASGRAVPAEVIPFR